MTIRKRQLKNGFSWEFCITISKNPRKQIRKSGFKTKAEAQKAEQDTIQKINIGKVCSDTLTFKQIADCFMEHAENYSKNTEYNYNNMLKDNSPFVVTNCIRFCKSMYNYAVSLDITESNPFNKARKIQLPKKFMED